MKWKDAKYNKPNSKIRRHSGRTTAKIYDPVEVPYEWVYWDDWNDYRDGFRHPDDKTQLRSLHCWWSESLEIKKYNEKLRKLIKRREAMKNAHKNRYC